MTREEIIEQLENTIGLIKQEGKDWFDDRDIPILEACIESLTALDKIRAEIESQRKEASKQNSDYYFGLNDGLKDARDIIDKYKVESEDDHD